MDIRDILKSFDSLSEAKTTTDKGVTTHKGDYGREFDTDDEGNAVVKKVKSTEPKPKGRRPDPDRPKLGKDDPKNKKVGDLFGRTTGAVPKGKKGTAISGKAQSHPDNKNDDGTGDEEPTSKKSLKEYFDQLDQALNEEGYSTAPMPGAVAVKDASGKVVATAKNPQAAAAFEKGDITIGGDEQGMAEGEMDEAVRAGYATTDWMKTPKKSAFEPATSHIRRPTNQAERDEVAAAVKNNRIGNKDYRINRIGAKSAAYGLDHTGYEDEYSMVRAQQDKGNTPKQWKMIPTAGDGKGLEEMYGPYDDDTVDAINAANPPKVSGTGMKPVTPAVHNTYDRKAVASNISGKDSAAYDQFTGRDKVTEKDVGKHNNATTGFDALVRKLTPKYGKEAATKIAVAQLKKMSEAEQPQHFAQSSPLSSNNRGVLEGKKGVNPFAKKENTDKKKCPPMSHVKKMCEKGMSMAKICTMHPDCDQKELKQMVTACKKTLKEATFKQEYRIFLESKGINVTTEMLEEGWKKKLAAAGTAAAIGATSLGMMGGLPGQNPADSSVMRPTEYSQQVQAGAPVTAKAEALAKINKQFAKEYQDGYLKIQDDPVISNSPKLANQLTIKFTQELLAKYQANESKKPDANKNRIPDYAEDGKGKNDLTKKGAAPKKGVNPFAKKTEKKNVKEGTEQYLQAARLEGKSHALRKMPYNCTHDGMEEARHYHDGFKEGLDECYGQMPIMGRTRVGEVSPTVGTMAGYGATGLGEMDKTSYMKQQAAKTPGDTFKAFGQTMSDNDVLDEFAFEAFDNQLSALLESEEKVSEGMTVSISKGQQGSPDSVSVSAQDGEADQLLSIIKSAGLGLFGGEEKGFNAPDGGAGAHGGINVVDDHDGMMALMKRLSGNEMSADDEQEEHSHEGKEETCESCGGMMEAGHSCDSKEVVDEVESEDQMAYKVAEDNPPDSGADNTDADVAGNAAANSAVATADAGQDEEEGQVYSSPTNEAEDETGEEAGEDDKKDFFHNPNVPADKQLKAPPKEVNVAESFANLYKKLAFLSEESTEKEDEKAEEAGKKVAKDIEDDEGHKGKDDDTAEKAGKKVTKDIEYDDKKDEKYKKDKKVDESYANSADDTFEADIGFMMNVISGGLNKQKSTGQTTVPVVSGQKSRMGVDGLGNPLKESTDLLRDYRKLSGL